MIFKPLSYKISVTSSQKAVRSGKCIQTLRKSHWWWCSSMKSICPASQRSWHRSLAPQNQNAYKKIKTFLSKDFPVLLVIPKAHGKEPATCRIKPPSSTMKKLLWFSLKYSHALEITSLGLFIKLLPVFMCTMCAWCS